MAKTDLTAARLRELLDYNPDTGVFTWRSSLSFSVPNGAPAGSITGSGYRVIGIDGVRHKSSILAWLYVFGELPTKKIIHLDGNKDSNKISNLGEACRDVTHDFVKKILKYDADTGVFWWVSNRGRGAKAGSFAGCIGPTGYWSIKIFGKHFGAHRLAWLYCNGVWPTNQIDHIDGNPLNNCINNLRESTQAENVQNFPVVSRNTSGHPGVCFDKARKKWVARISTGNKVANLGRFEVLEDAANAYKLAKAQYHTFNPEVRQ